MSPISHRAKVQKPSKETRKIQELFQVNAEAIKECPDLESAAQILADSLPSPHAWNSLDHDLLSKIENHAEALLSDPDFVDAFADWSGLDEIRHFCNDKKWWKRRRNNTQSTSRTTSLTSFSRVGRRKRRVILEDSFDSPPASSMDTTSVDISQEELAMETPAHGNRRTASKGTSVLRPSMSVSRTPATPTRPGNESPASNIVDLTSPDDEELRLLRLPEDVSQRIKKDISEAEKTRRLLTRKRKFEVIQDDDDEKPRKPQKSSNPLNKPLRFGRGRPPLTTVTVSIHFLSLSDYSCHSLRMNAVRYFDAHSQNVHTHDYVRILRPQKQKSINITIPIVMRFVMHWI